MDAQSSADIVLQGGSNLVSPGSPHTIKECLCWWHSKLLIVVGAVTTVLTVFIWAMCHTVGETGVTDAVPEGLRC